MKLFEVIANFIKKGNDDSYQFQAIISWLESQGGVTGVMDKFRNEGLGALVESWIGSGTNLPVSTEQITGVLGSSAIEALASKLGMNTNNASLLLSELLPRIVSGLADGKENSLSDILSSGMKFFKK